MKRSLILAAIIAIGVAAWLASGQFSNGAGTLTGAPEADPAETAKAAVVVEPGALMAVRVRTQTAQRRSREIVVRGRTDVVREVDVKSEIAARVTAVLVEEGARVKRNQVIARLDMRDRASRLEEVKALVRQREMEYEAAKALARKGYRAETKHAEAVTLMRSAEAQKARLEVEIGHTFLRAPFDGVLEKRYAELGDFLKDGNPVARVVDTDPLLVVAQVSEREIGYLKLGDPARVELVSGETLTGKLDFLGTSADEATRTFRIEVELPNADLALRAGVTAELEISVGEIAAHLVSPAVLTLNDQGALGIKLIEGDGRVAFHRVEILSDEADGVWLAGLPDTITVITVGQEFVRDGETVRAVPESATGSAS